MRGADEADGMHRKGDGVLGRRQPEMVDVDEGRTRQERKEARHSETANESQSEKAEIADKHAVTAEDAAEAAADARRRRPGLRQEEREEHDPEECGDGYRHEDRPPAEGGDQAA